MIATIRSYGNYNHRRYSKPWAALMNNTGGMQFCGWYTGNHEGEEGGNLTVTMAEEGQVYAFGQKDLRKPQSSESERCIFHNGKFYRITRKQVVAALNDPAAFCQMIDETGMKSIDEE